MQSVVKHVVPGTVTAEISGYESSGEMAISGVTLSRFTGAAAHLSFVVGLAADAGVEADEIQLGRAETNPDGTVQVQFSLTGFPPTDAGAAAALGKLARLQAAGGLANAINGLAITLLAEESSISCSVAGGSGVLAVYTVKMEVSSSAQTGEMHLYSAAGSGVLEAAVQDALSAEGSPISPSGIYVAPASVGTAQKVLKTMMVAACPVLSEAGSPPPATGCPQCTCAGNSTTLSAAAPAAKGASLLVVAALAALASSIAAMA